MILACDGFILGNVMRLSLLFPFVCASSILAGCTSLPTPNYVKEPTPNGVDGNLNLDRQRTFTTGYTVDLSTLSTDKAIEASALQKLIT